MENRASPRDPMLPIKDVLHNICQKITSEVPEKTTSIEEPKEVCSVCNGQRFVHPRRADGRLIIHASSTANASLRKGRCRGNRE